MDLRDQLQRMLGDAYTIERFKREVALAARLQQANIVPLLAAGDMNGLPFFTMPYIEGESLLARLTAGGSRGSGLRCTASRPTRREIFLRRRRTRGSGYRSLSIRGCTVWRRLIREWFGRRSDQAVTANGG
jgi:serine/threonine protein kinase